MKTQEFDTPGSRFRRNVVWFIFLTNDRRVILDRIACLVIGTIIALLVLWGGKSCDEQSYGLRPPQHFTRP